MLIGFLLGIVSLALRLASLALLIYCVMSFVMPGSDLFRKASTYVQPLLQPVRQKLYQWFPSLRRLPVDLSPLGLWLAMDIAMALVNLLRRIF